MSVEIRTLKGEEILPVCADIARLRIEVFRDYPYLYDGTADYEERYLARFAQANDATAVLAVDKEQIVGAATALPLEEEHEEFIVPFQVHGFDVTRVFYCAESVLNVNYRGFGLGHRFFDEREKVAIGLNRFDWIVFCGVVRPFDHPKRPGHYRPLDGFWCKRGYEPIEGMTTLFAWKDIDQDKETSKTMQFWGKKLRQADNQFVP